MTEPTERRCRDCRGTGWMAIHDTRDPDPAYVPCKYCGTKPKDMTLAEIEKAHKGKRR